METPLLSHLQPLLVQCSRLCSSPACPDQTDLRMSQKCFSTIKGCCICTNQLFLLDGDDLEGQSCSHGKTAADVMSDDYHAVKLAMVVGRSVRATWAPRVAKRRPTRPQPLPSSTTCLPYTAQILIQSFCGSLVSLCRSIDTEISVTCF